MSTDILELIENAPYEETTELALVDNVIQQFNGNKPYSFDANKALMKIYQINSNNAKADIVAKIMALSLMNLPSSDLLAITYLIPRKLASDTVIETMLKRSDLLERGQYIEFWESYPEGEIFSSPNFIKAIKNFILINISDTFKSITKDHFKSALGLNDNEITSFANDNKHIIADHSGDSISFVPKASHTIKASKEKETETLVVGEVLRIVDSIKECRSKK